jgi:hypothetical protein
VKYDDNEELKALARSSSLQATGKSTRLSEDYKDRK